MILQLGWLDRIRSFVGLAHAQPLQQYQETIENYLNAYQQYSGQCKVSRSSKRQHHMNLKVLRRESIVKRHRDSGIRKMQKQSSPSQTSHHLASILLQKQTKHYENIIQQIVSQLKEVQDWLQSPHIPKELLLSFQQILRERPTMNWKYLLTKVECRHNTLNLSLRTLIGRKNELDNLTSKFIIS